MTLRKSKVFSFALVKLIKDPENKAVKKSHLFF